MVSLLPPAPAMFPTSAFPLRPALAAACACLGLLLAACSTSGPTRSASAAKTGCVTPLCCDLADDAGFEPRRLYCRAESLRESGQTEASAQALQEAIAAAQAAGATPAAQDVLCYAMNAAGNAADERDDHAAAAQAHAASLAACSARHGTDSSEYAQAAYALANARLDAGDHGPETGELLAAALRISRARQLRPLQAFTLDALGRRADLEGDRADGSRQLHAALDLKRELFGDRSTEVATTLTNLGANAMESGQPGVGQAWYREAAERYRDALGARSRRYISVMSALANSYLTLGQYDRAEPIYRELIASSAEVYGSDDERHVILVNDYGALLFRNGQALPAANQFRQALEIRRRVRPDTLTTAWTAYNVAQAERQAHDCKAAQPFQHEAHETLVRLQATDVANEPDFVELHDAIAELDRACAATAKPGRAHGDAHAAAKTQIDESAYETAVYRQIASNWLRPDTADAKALRCPVRIRQMPGGRVRSAEPTADCNADEATRTSILRAIDRAQPLPYEGYEKAFREDLVLVFTAQ